MNPSSWIGAGGVSNLQVLWEDGERVFCRRESHADGYRAAVLAVLPAAEHPTPATLDRLAREYGLKDELDGAWAVRPLAFVRERGQSMLVLEDTRSEPLDRLFGEASVNAARHIVAQQDEQDPHDEEHDRPWLAHISEPTVSAVGSADRTPVE